MSENGLITGATYRVNKDGRTKQLPKIITTNNDVESRTTVFLKLYGQDYNVWRKYAQKHYIRTEVAMCIAWADTHLGYATKTKNNLGNVGNTDSGRTRTPDTLEQGIEAIFHTLNNQYLGEKQTIGDLSYAGDCNIDCDKVYATSNENRQNNVLNCLSLIHKKQIGPEFQFRADIGEPILSK